MSRKLLRHPQRDSMSNTSRRRLGKALVDGMLLAQHGRPKERPNILRRRRQQIADGKLGMTAVYSAVAGPAASGKALAKSLPSMFAKTLHLTNNSVRRTIPGTPPKVVVDSEYRAYFLPHRDATSAPYWQATLRFSEEQEARIRAKPEWNELFGQKYLVIPWDDTKGIVRLLEWYEETRKEAGDGAE